VKKYIRVDEVAKKLSISKSTAWRWVREGKLPAPLQVTQRTTLWDEEEVENFLAAAKK